MTRHDRISRNKSGLSDWALRLSLSLSCINLVFLSTNNFQSAEKRDNILEIFHTFYIKLEHIKE